ncbi:unnamed protein product [Fraxinus pennsylvanica]|uniref:Uncharacterized protein n=1 Tax=Fraxinus pennsylvanica TaxID=56036 RepID=A0AAD2EFH1_9LAMI|nr:unnamed protein product [Fraxinus pennsylvanica]
MQTKETDDEDERSIAVAGAAEEELKLEADDFKFKVEGIVKQLAVAGDHDKITEVINLLTTEFTYSTKANHRKGGLIGLAAATVGLTSEAAQHLENFGDSIIEHGEITDRMVIARIREGNHRGFKLDMDKHRCLTCLIRMIFSKNDEVGLVAFGTKGISEYVN